jgi:hypothetical protein
MSFLYTTSVLPPSAIKYLSDRSYDKRKLGALEVQDAVRGLYGNKEKGVSLL